ncbi:hypothetical protein ABA45_10710 [Marinobacter psychrophilus]|uniref:Uncharacterized protein n=1 Tax=Marinobacter psychrophilus TaxID=330734 RepID=A0A0H4ICR1_9GAMM|nr:hypothetical protein ABA45_10710 [Marinobacter psychrophilus]
MDDDGRVIAQLSALPPDTPVLVEGYETEFDRIVDLIPQKIIRYRNAQGWDGEYQATDNFSDPETGALQAIVGEY